MVNLHYATFSGEGEHREKLTVPYAVDLWINEGFPASKIALGLGTYGRGFMLRDAKNHGLGAPKADWQNPPKGKYTREAGFLAYYEICDWGFSIVKDNPVGAPYGHKGKEWVGYDDEESLVHKVQSQVKGMLPWQHIFTKHSGILVTFLVLNFNVSIMS